MFLDTSITPYLGHFICLTILLYVWILARTEFATNVKRINDDIRFISNDSKSQLMDFQFGRRSSRPLDDVFIAGIEIETVSQVENLALVLNPSLISLSGVIILDVTQFGIKNLEFVIYRLRCKQSIRACLHESINFIHIIDRIILWIYLFICYAIHCRNKVYSAKKEYFPNPYRCPRLFELSITINGNPLVTPTKPG